MSDYIFVPKGNDLNQVGGFSFSEVVSHEFFPKGYKHPGDTEGREQALLKINLRGKEQPLHFFGLVAENLMSQIEDVLLGRR